MKSLVSQAREFNLGSTAAFRLAGLTVSLIANVAVIAIFTSQFGVASYAAYAVVASLINLLPFADLGLGASVVNSTSDHHAGLIPGKTYGRHLARTRDILLLVALIIVAIDLILFFTNRWPTILGVVGAESGVAGGAAYTLGCVALAIPLGIGARILQGRSQVLLVVKLGLLGPTLQIFAVGIFWISDSPPWLYFLGPGTAYLVVALLTFIVGMRHSGVKSSPLFRAFRKVGRDVRLADTALPFLVISIGMALGFQSHRLLLAHFGTANDLAQYSVVAQFVGPVLAVISVVGQNLWNAYRSGLSSRTLTLSTFSAHLRLFGSLGLVCAIAVNATVPFLTLFISGGTVQPTLALCAAAGLYVATVAIHQPSAMLLNTSRGLWIQASAVVVVGIGSIAAIASLTSLIGATSAYLATALCMIVFQVIPSVVIARVSIRRSHT